MLDHATSVVTTTTDPAIWMVAKGYRFAGVVSHLRSEAGRRDVGAIISDSPASAAGVFTLNRVAAAPVQVARNALSELPAPDSQVASRVGAYPGADSAAGAAGAIEPRSPRAAGSTRAERGLVAVAAGGRGSVGPVGPVAEPDARRRSSGR